LDFSIGSVLEGRERKMFLLMREKLELGKEAG